MKYIHKSKIKRKKENTLTKKDFHPKNVKTRVSMWISQSTLDAYREKALELGIGYQTLMQIKLKESLEEEDIKSRLVKIEKTLSKQIKAS